MARVQSRAQPPQHPEESVQSPPCPTASVAGICLLSIYHRWALAIKWIAPRGDCASISTIKPDSGAASRALHRHPVSNGYPRASRCPFLSTVKPGDACWLTQRHMRSKKKHLVTFTSRLEFFYRDQCSKEEEFWIMTRPVRDRPLLHSASFIPCPLGTRGDVMRSPEFCQKGFVFNHRFISRISVDFSWLPSVSVCWIAVNSKSTLDGR